MVRKKSIHFILHLTFAVSFFCIHAFLSPLYAQDEVPVETVESPGPTDAENGLSEESTPPEISEGISHGAYWWAEIDPVAIQAFHDFGVDTISIRLGKLGINPGRQQGVFWVDGGNYDELATLPMSLSYRLVIETGDEFWPYYTNQKLANWIESELIPNFSHLSVEIQSLEVKINTHPDNDVLDFIEGAKDVSPDFEIDLGFNAIEIGTVPGSWFREAGSFVDGLVVYFINDTFEGIMPKIIDRSWVDYTIGELNTLGVPFTTVFPIYNKSILFQAANPGDGLEIPPIDLDLLADFGVARQLGAAGIEITLTRDYNAGEISFLEGDKIRILESLKEIDLKEVIQDLPSAAPNLNEIALFRFPLIPGFDPTANRALTEAGWLAGSRESSFDPVEAEKEQLDEKHNQGSQVIMMITLGLMMFLLMRMMSRGKAKEGGEGGGK
ncbi:hypothetical protein KAU08_05145 [bacterium]|nr:hypothetical protein [bacterium]